MDIGFFRRRKTAFWLWITLPVVLVAVVRYGTAIYCRRCSTALLSEEALAQYLPRMEVALQQSKAEIARFRVISGTPAAARAALNTRISEISTACGLVVDNLRISSQTGEGPVRRLEAGIEGSGSLLPVMKFLDRLQSPKSLISLADARLTLSKVYPVPVYHWSFGFRTGFVVPSGENAK